MRFLMLIKANAAFEAGEPPHPALLEKMGPYVEASMSSGVLVTTGGLLPSSAGARIKVGGKRMRVVDGPFAEAKELVGGFAIIEAPDTAAAIEHGKRFMQLHVDVLGDAYEGELEIRPLASM